MAWCGAGRAWHILGLAQSAWLSAAQYGTVWHGMAQYSTSRGWQRPAQSVWLSTSWHCRVCHVMTQHVTAQHGTAQAWHNLSGLTQPSKQLWHTQDGLGLVQSAWHHTAQHGEAWGWHSRAQGWELGVVQPRSVQVATGHHRVCGLGQHCPAQHSTARSGTAWSSMA